jgi:hypothetical protein
MKQPLTLSNFIDKKQIAGSLCVVVKHCVCACRKRRQLILLYEDDMVVIIITEACDMGKIISTCGRGTVYIFFLL